MLSLGWRNAVFFLICNILHPTTWPLHFSRLMWCARPSNLSFLTPAHSLPYIVQLTPLPRAHPPVHHEMTPMWLTPLVTAVTSPTRNPSREIQSTFRFLHPYPDQWNSLVVDTLIKCRARPTIHIHSSWGTRPTTILNTHHLRRYVPPCFKTFKKFPLYAVC